MYSIGVDYVSGDLFAVGESDFPLRDECLLYGGGTYYALSFVGLQSRCANVLLTFALQTSMSMRLCCNVHPRRLHAPY